MRCPPCSWGSFSWTWRAGWRELSALPPQLPRPGTPCSPRRRSQTRSRSRSRPAAAAAATSLAPGSAPPRPRRPTAAQPLRPGLPPPPPPMATKGRGHVNETAALGAGPGARCRNAGSQRLCAWGDVTALSCAQGPLSVTAPGLRCGCGAVGLGDRALGVLSLLYCAPPRPALSLARVTAAPGLSPGPGRGERGPLRQQACVGWASGTRSHLSRRCHLACCGTAPSLPGQAGPGSSNTPCLANKPGCAPPRGAQLTAGYQRQDVGARLSGRMEVARCSPPELLSSGLKLQDPWGRGSQCHSQ